MNYIIKESNVGGFNGLFFSFFFFNSFCMVVAMRDLLHDVETLHHANTPLQFTPLTPHF